MVVSNKSIGLFPQLKGVLLVVVAAVLLANVTPVLEAAPDAKAGVNPGQTKILDPFSLVVKTVSKKPAKWIEDPNPEKLVNVPGKPRPRSGFTPGKP
jgi:hypothetical protein